MLTTRRNHRPSLATRVAQRRHAERMARLGMFASEALAFAGFVALLGAIVLGGVALAAPSYGPCASEDSANCYWDAKARGNGAGQSFIDIDGRRYAIGE